MNAITTVFNRETRHNPQILEQWEKGRLTIGEAVKTIALQTLDTVRSEGEKEYIMKQAERIREIDLYEAWDTDTTAEDIAGQIKTDPESIIAYLLDVIENLQ